MLKRLIPLVIVLGACNSVVTNVPSTPVPGAADVLIGGLYSGTFTSVGLVLGIPVQGPDDVNVDAYALQNMSAVTMSIVAQDSLGRHPAVRGTIHGHNEKGTFTANLPLIVCQNRIEVPLRGSVSQEGHVHFEEVRTEVTCNYIRGTAMVRAWTLKRTAATESMQGPQPD